MISKTCRNEVRRRKHLRVRKKISGTGARPRLCVFRSLSHVYAQVIDDTKGITLAQASSMEPDMKKVAEDKNKVDISKLVGKTVAERALQAGITNVVFDRGGYVYLGRIASLADGAREAGLKF